MSEATVLQERVRADRHATSYPLIVIGAVGFHYVSAPFSAPVSVVYGIPLAFVVVWGLQWRNERRTGVGSGNDEALLVAFGVFMLASLFASTTWLTLMPMRFEDNVAFWSLVPAAAGLAAIGQRQRNRALVASAGVIVVGCALGEVFGDGSWATDWWYVPYRDLINQLAFLAVTVGGVIIYRRERAISES